MIVHGSRDSGELRSAFEEIRALAPASTMEMADLADDNSIGAMFKRCVRVDALINNAATQNPSPFVDLKEADWDRILAVNLKAPFLCAQASRPEL